MHEGVAHLVFQFQRLFVGVVVAALHQADLCAEALGGLHLGDGGGVRQADEGFDAVLGGRQRHALGVVARRAGDDAPGLFLFGEHRNFVPRAPHLEGAGDLQVFRLEIEFALRRDAIGPYHGGFPHDVFQHPLGVEYLVER